MEIIMDKQKNNSIQNQDTKKSKDFNDSLVK